MTRWKSAYDCQERHCQDGPRPMKFQHSLSILASDPSREIARSASLVPETSGKDGKGSRWRGHNRKNPTQRSPLKEGKCTLLGDLGLKTAGLLKGNGVMLRRESDEPWKGTFKLGRNHQPGSPSFELNYRPVLEINATESVTAIKMQTLHVKLL